MKKLLHTISIVAFSLMLLSAAALDAEAQRPGGGRGGPRGGGRGGGPGGGPGRGGALELLGRGDVQGELQLSDDQKQSLQEMQASFRDSDDVRRISDRIRSAESDEERQAALTEMRSLLESKVNSVLNEQQRGRLHQLSLQRQGVRALTNPDVAGQMNVSEDQQSQIAELSGKYEEARRELRSNRDLSENERDAQLDALRADYEKNVNSLLSDQQRRAFQQQQGKTFEFAESADPQRGPPGGGPPPRSVGGATPPAASPAASAAPVVVEAPEGATTAASFGEPGEGGNGESIKQLSFNFRYAPWTDVLTLFAETANLTLDLNAVPPGTFNYRDSRKYTPTEALDVLNGYLIQKGYILVRRDEFLVVVNIDNGIPPNLVPTIDVEDLPKRGRNELMSVLLPLTGMTADEAAQEASQLLGPQGKVVPLAKANKIVVTDIGSNLRRIQQLLSDIQVEDGDKVFRKFELEHINVLDADLVVRDLFGLGGRGVENVSGSSNRYDPRSRYGSSSSSRDPRDPRYAPAPADENARVTVALDERTNSLLVTASPTDMKIIEEAIEAVDLPPLDGVSGRSSREPYFEVYQLESADAMEVTKTLNVLFPGTVVNEDGKSRRIHIQATEDVHREIADTIRRLDGAGGLNEMAVIPLGRMDSYTATTSIQSLFYSEGTDAPVIQPHPTANALIVRGSHEQVSQIKLLVAELEPADGSAYTGSGRIRTIPLGGRDPEEFLEALERVWNVRGRNPIRTVIPSEGGAIRDRRVPSATSPFSEPAVEEQPVPVEEPAVTPTPLKPASSPSSAFRKLEKNPLIESASGGEQIAFNFDANAYAQAASDDSDVSDDLRQLFLDLEASEADREKASDTNGGEAATGESTANAPIAITIQGGNLVAVSDDEEALDRLESMISALSQAMPPRTQWTVFYLRSADATQTAAILERLFPTSSVTTSLGGSDGGFMSELTGGLSSMGRGLMNMSGLDSVLTGPQTLRIIPDVRSNSLFVTGPPHLIDEVEDVLRILDASELPEQLRDRAPRYISVKHAQVDEVAAIIRDVFKEELTPPQPVQQGRGGGGGNPLAALMGGGGSSAPSQKVQMTLGVDYQNSRLYVSANEPLFQQIQAMVEEIDQASLEARRTIRVVPLEHANTTILQQTIGNLVPQVKVSTSSTSSRSSSSNGSNSNSNSGSNSEEQLRQMFIQRAMERARGGGPGGGGGGGGPFGGGRPGGGGGGGPFGGGRPGGGGGRGGR